MVSTARLFLPICLAVAAFWPSQMVLCQELDGSVDFEWRGGDCGSESATGDCVPSEKRGSDCQGCSDYEIPVWGVTAGNRLDNANDLALDHAVEFTIDWTASLLECAPQTSPRASKGQIRSASAPRLAATVQLL